MDGLKDSPGRIILVGIMIPLCLLALVGWNLVAQKVYWPNDSDRYSTAEKPFLVYTDPLRLWGTILVKSGFAAGIFV